MRSVEADDEEAMALTQSKVNCYFICPPTRFKFSSAITAQCNMDHSWQSCTSRENGKPITTRTAFDIFSRPPPPYNFQGRKEAYIGASAAVLEAERIFRKETGRTLTVSVVGSSQRET